MPQKQTPNERFGKSKLNGNVQRQTNRIARPPATTRKVTRRGQRGN